jgi:hypothetical protein
MPPELYARSPAAQQKEPLFITIQTMDENGFFHGSIKIQNPKIFRCDTIVLVEIR